MNLAQAFPEHAGGENQKLEFKQCREKVNKDLYESLCAFLNRFGGEIFLGVDDDGEVTGINPEALTQIKKDLVTTLNNGQKIYPPCYIEPQVLELEGKSIIRLLVPESSQVHRCSAKIFDRNDDGDFDVTNQTQQVAALYLRKQSTYSENKIFPFVKLNDLREDLIRRARQMAVNHRAGHAWEALSDFDLLKSAQLYQKDVMTGQEGFTLAAILLFGKDPIILSALPHHRTDALVRIKNLDRYDPR